MLNLTPMETGEARGWTRAFLILGVSTMTAAWLSVWVALLAIGVGTSLLLPGPALEAIVLGAAAAAGRLLAGPLGERTARALFTAAGLMVALMAVWARFYWRWFPLDPRWLGRVSSTHPTEPVAATGLVALALWWMGGRLGASPLDDYAAFRFFATGVAGLFGGLILGAMAGAHDSSTSMLGLATLVFFVAAFLTLPAAQLASVRERGRARGSRLPPLDRRWAGTAGAATVGILALALLLSAASSGALLSMAAALLGRLPDLLVTILSPLIIAGGYLAAALVDLVRHLIGKPHPKPLPAPNAAMPAPVHGAQHHAHAPAIVQAIAGGIVAVVVAVIVVALLSRAIGRLSAHRRDAAFEEERDSVWSWEEAGAGWHGILGRLRGRLHRGLRSPRPGVEGPPRSVREAYRRLLRRGAALGHARAAPETPQEYLGRLHDIPFADERDATLLTAAYMRIRYGEEPEGPEEVERAARSWERLDASLGRPPAASGSGARARTRRRRRRMIDKDGAAGDAN